MTKLRVIFMGSPDFAVPSLASLIDAGHDLCCVYAQPPKPAGRGQKERPTPVHAFAAAKGVEVRTPKSLKGREEQRAFAALGADVAVVAAYGLILPKPVLDVPRLGCVNLHASVLPRWRGAAPIHRAILAGDTESGVTLMQMDEGLDTGDILAVERVPITATTTAADLHDALAETAAEMIAPGVEALAAGKLVVKPQPQEGVTYAAKLSRDEGRMDWTRSAEDLERMVRGLNPWPGVWFEHDGTRIKVLSAEIVEAPVDSEPGKVLDDALTIACATGALRPTRVQRPGKGPMDANAFLRGYALPQGVVLA